MGRHLTIICRFCEPDLSLLRKAIQDDLVLLKPQTRGIVREREHTRKRKAHASEQY